MLRYRKPKRALAAVAAVFCALLAVLLLANPFGDSGEVYYGVLQYSSVEGIQGLLLELPRSDGNFLPEAEQIVSPGGEAFEGFEPGDLVKITFPAGVHPRIQETYPGEFTEDAESIEIIARGGFRLSYEGADLYLAALPLSLAPEAEQGDTLEIWYRRTGLAAGRELLASVPVLTVDEINDNFWIELSTEDTETFLREYGSGIECRLTAPNPEEALQEEESARGETPAVITKELLSAGEVPDGLYRIYIRSISRSPEAVELYVVDGWDADVDGPLPVLPFADFCAYLVNQEMNTLRYEAVSFDEFADAVSGGERMNVPCTITMQDGLITRADVDSAWYGAGISYEPPVRDAGFEQLQESLGMTGEEILENYYTLNGTEQADISESRGMETIEIYTGNTGDGESGLVLFRNKDGELLYSITAHTARAGWNNIYLVEDGGVSCIMTVHEEDRDTYGEYSYQVFWLGAYGQILQTAGSSWNWNLEENSLPDEEILQQWTDGLKVYLENSRLLLSTQNGELRFSGMPLEMRLLEEYSALYAE